MLGRLRMTTEECLNTYRELSPRIFANTTSHSFGLLSAAAGKAWFKGDTLKAEVVKLLRQRGFLEDELMKESDNPDCKVQVSTPMLYMQVAFKKAHGSTF
jgi:hypothetical protein